MEHITQEVFIGNFGSGKTELALNFAVKSAAKGAKTVLCDLDIVNPYFLSSAQAQLLQSANVDLIKTAYAGTGVDVPAVPAEAVKIFSGDYDMAVIDVGGDPAGAKVLGRYHKEFHETRDTVNCNMVINTRRPMTATAAAIVSMCRQIEERARIKVNWLINNTNLAEETTPEIVLDGQKIIEEAGSALDIPVRCIAATQPVLAKLGCTALPLWEVTIYMRPGWLQGTKTGSIVQIRR